MSKSKVFIGLLISLKLINCNIPCNRLCLNINSMDSSNNRSCIFNRNINTTCLWYTQNVIMPCHLNCNITYPCLHDNNGDFSCKETNSFGNCFAGTTICPDMNVCDKICSELTKGRPCMNKNYKDNTCYNHLIHGSCPAGTIDCVSDKTDPCQYCDNEYKCLRDNYGDYSCLKIDINGLCPIGSNICTHMNGNQLIGDEIGLEIMNNKDVLSYALIISIVIFIGVIIGLIGILFGIYWICYRMDMNNKNKFIAVDVIET